MGTKPTAVGSQTLESGTMNIEKKRITSEAKRRRAAVASQLLEGSKEQFEKLSTHRRHLTLLNFNPSGHTCRPNCGFKHHMSQLNTMSDAVVQSDTRQETTGSRADKFLLKEVLQHKLDDVED